jgi:hypothetical protein
MSDPSPSTPLSLTMMSTSGSDALSNQNYGSPSERSQSSPKEPSPPKSRPSAERVFNRNCAIQKIAEARRLFTDHENLCPFGLYGDEMGSQGVVEELLKYSVSLQLDVVTLRKKTDAEGQACFLQTRKGIVMATVKHNFCEELNNNGSLEVCISSVVMSPGKGAEVFPFKVEPGSTLIGWDARHLTHSDKHAFKFNSNGNPDAAWKYGMELEFIPMNDPNRNGELMNAFKQGDISIFEAVRTTFNCEVGMQVGIMAHSCVNLLATSMERSLHSGPEHYAAQKGDTFITVGNITHVGTDHIEYAVNTVPGFSGAPVILLTCKGEHHIQLIATCSTYYQKHM